MTETTTTPTSQPTNTAAEAEVTGHAMDAFLIFEGIKGDAIAGSGRPGVLPTVSLVKGTLLGSQEYRR